LTISTLLSGAGCAAAVLALAAPAAQASDTETPVCNQASPHFQGGSLYALDAPVDSPAARYTENLWMVPGRGAGLVEAAGNSPSLTLCGGLGTDEWVAY
jgi:hypothetical protein